MVRFSPHLSTIFLLGFPSMIITFGEAMISGRECLNQGGEIVRDIGDGAIFQPQYVCPKDGFPPTDLVIPEIGQATITIEGAVCCGGTGKGIVGPDGQTPPQTSASFSVSDPSLFAKDCKAAGGVIINDKKGDGAIYRNDYLCEENGQPPMGTLILPNGEPMSSGGQVCCPAPTAEATGGTNVTLERDEYTRQECKEQGGMIVGDIGDGATMANDYICESNGEPPIATVIPVDDEEPRAIDGEVCCMLPTKTSFLEEQDNQEDSGANLLGFVSNVGLMIVVGLVLVTF